MFKLPDFKKLFKKNPEVDKKPKEEEFHYKRKFFDIRNLLSKFSFLKSQFLKKKGRGKRTRFRIL